MKKYRKVTPEGTRDLLFEVCSARRMVEKRLRELFERRGFREVMTPGLEFYDVFSSSDRYFPQENLYKLSDNKGRLLVMRPDTTIPIARLCATKLQNHSLPIRLYYNQTIYRMNQMMNGGSHEMMQMGVELLGAKEGLADLEILALGAESLANIGAVDYRLEIGHTGILKGLLERLAATEEEKETITDLIAKKNVDALKLWTSKWSDSPEMALLCQLPLLFGTEEVFAQCREVFQNYSADLLQAIDDLEQVYRSLLALGLAGKIIVDFALADQADYYTALVFRGYLEGVGEAVLSGGRYDRLLSDFGRDLPAIGFGLQVDLLAQALLPTETISPIHTALVWAEDGYWLEGIALCQELSRSTESCELGLMATVEEALTYARNKGLSKVYLVGDTTKEVPV